MDNLFKIYEITQHNTIIEVEGALDKNFNTYFFITDDGYYLKIGEDGFYTYNEAKQFLIIQLSQQIEQLCGTIKKLAKT